MEPGLQANTAVVASQQQAEAEQKAHNETADKMSGSFEALASTAVAKAETIERSGNCIAHEVGGQTYGCQQEAGGPDRGSAEQHGAWSKQAPTGHPSAIHGVVYHIAPHQAHREHDRGSVPHRASAVWALPLRHGQALQDLRQEEGTLPTQRLPRATGKCGS